MTEQEDKFEVDSDWVMPQLAELLPDGGRLDHEVRKLDNTYFDTPGAGLRLFGITLRRRVGGSETGWQLKVPSGTARTELQSGSRAKTMAGAPAGGGGGGVGGGGRAAQGSKGDGADGAAERLAREVDAGRPGGGRAGSAGRRAPRPRCND